MKKIIVHILSIVLIFLLHSTGNPSDTKSKVIQIGIASFPHSLNPVYAADETSQLVANKIYDSLYYYDCSGTITNGLAENSHIKQILTPPRSVSSSHSSLRAKIEIQLKKSIFFSDGKELDAEDVIRTIKLLQDKKFGYYYRSELDFIENIEKIDRYRFQLTITDRLAAWKDFLLFKILNSKEIKQATPDGFHLMKLSGTGPYKIKNISLPHRITLEANSKYSPSPVDIEFTVVSYSYFIPLKLLNREIQIGEIQPEHAASYSTNKEWQESFSLEKYTKKGYTYLVFNTRNSLIDKNLRKFFYNFLIAGDFLDRFLNRRGERVYSPFLFIDEKVKPAPLVSTPIREKTRLKLLVNSESGLRKEFMFFLVEELKRYNLELEPVTVEYHSFLEYLKKGRFDLAISGYVFDSDYDAKLIFNRDSYFNYSQSSYPEMETLVEQGINEPDRQKRKALYLEAHRIWLKELPFLPLFKLYYYMGISRQLEIPPNRYKTVPAAGDFLYNLHQYRFK